MSSPLPYLVLGLTAGSVYALSAMGLSLTYATTGVFNFAQGALGAVAAYIFYDLTGNGGVSWPIAALICTVGIGSIGGVLLERLGTVLARVDTSMQVVATVGLSVALQALIVIHYGSSTVPVQSFLPTGLHSIGGTEVGTDQMIIVGLALASVVVLTIVRQSRFGTRMRAVVDDPALLSLAGVAPARVRRGAWLIGSTFACAAGILAVAAVGTLDPTILTLLLINAFGAAALGAFRSIPLTYLGGLAIGVAASFATKYIHGTGFIAPLPSMFPLLVLFVVLLMTPRRKLVVRSTLKVAALPLRRLRPLKQEMGLGVGAVVILLLAPSLLGHTRLIALTGSVVFAILLLSLVLLVKFSGQVSLCQYGLAAVGACAFYKLVGSVGLPWPLAVLLAGLITVPVGAMIAIPAIRLSGLFLALATLAFGYLLQGLFYSSNLMFTSQSAVASPRPGFATSDAAYYRITVLILVLCAVLVIAVERTRLGRLLRGLEQSPTTLVTHGTNLNVTRVIVFSLSAFLAGIAGALYGPITGTLSQNPFDPANSLMLLALLILAGKGALRPAMIGGAALSLIPSYITSATVVNWLPVLYGVSAIVIATATSYQSGRRAQRPSVWARLTPSRPSRAALNDGSLT